MSFKLLKPLATSGKMEVTPQQSEILQNELFKMGYEAKHHKSYINGNPFIIWYNGLKCVGFSEHNRNFFEKHYNTLHHFNEHFKIEEL